MVSDALQGSTKAGGRRGAGERRAAQWPLGERKSERGPEVGGGGSHAVVGARELRRRLGAGARVTWPAR